MAKSKTHDNLIYITTPFIILGSMAISKYFVINEMNFVPIVTFSYIIGGLFLSPDLDINSSPYNRWGILKFIWLPYQRMVKHRSVISHGIIIGTFLRLLYLITFIGVIVALNTHQNLLDFYKVVVNLLKQYELYSLSIFCSVELSSICHIVADWVL